MKNSVEKPIMTHELSPVVVLQLPQRINAQARRFVLTESVRRMDASRPRVVFDCSRLQRLDEAIVHLLLCCLEEAMKRNGDIKLAALPGEAYAIFVRFGLDGLFEVFDTVPGAVSSFRHLPLDRMPKNDALVGPQYSTAG